MDERTSVAVFGLPGFGLLEVVPVDTELEYLIETTADVAGCATCGTVAKAKDRREVLLRDLPHGEWAVRLRWRKRVWSCPDPDCPTKSWSESSWLAAPRRHLTERARAEICRRVGEDNASVATCAKSFGVGWHAAWSAVLDEGTALVKDPERTAGVRAVGLDETMYLHAHRGRRRVLVTGVVDVECGRLLDVFMGRDAKDLRGAPLLRTGPFDRTLGVPVRRRQTPSGGLQLRVSRSMASSSESQPTARTSCAHRQAAAILAAHASASSREGTSMTVRPPTRSGYGPSVTVP